MSPIVTADIIYRLSGGAANTDPDASLGGAPSLDDDGVIAPGAANNLWDDVIAAESEAGLVEFRALYVVNDHETITWEDVVVWIDELTVSADTELDIGLASEGVGVPIAQTLAEEDDVPTGVTFTRPVTKATGIMIGDIAPGSFKGIWLRRTITAGAIAFADEGSIRCEGTTGA